MQHITTKPQQKFLMVRPAKLASMLSISTDCLRSTVKNDPSFPPKVYFGRVYGWSMKSIEQYIAAKELEGDRT